ncbi:MAG: hypothetical protein RI926_564, partial [Actinomycetota bacterium]
ACVGTSDTDDAERESELGEYSSNITACFVEWTCASLPRHLMTELETR